MSPPRPSPPPPEPPRYPGYVEYWQPPPPASPPLPAPPPPPPAGDGVNYCGGTKVAAGMAGSWYGGKGHPIASVDWYTGEYNYQRVAGWELYRGSGMLNSVAVANDSTTTTRDVPGIHVATEDFTIAQPDENGVIPTDQHYQAFNSASPSAPAPSHEAHFKALTNVPRSMLALTTCNAWMGGSAGPVYHCAGAGVRPIKYQNGGRSSIDVMYEGGKEWKSAPDYLTSKIWAR